MFYKEQESYICSLCDTEINDIDYKYIFNYNYVLVKHICKDCISKIKKDIKQEMIKDKKIRPIIPPIIRRELYNSSNVCMYCNDKLNKHNRTIDHVKPLSLGGLNIKENMGVCCRDCNNGKNDFSLPEWKNKIQTQYEYLNKKEKLKSNIIVVNIDNIIKENIYEFK